MVAEYKSNCNNNELFFDLNLRMRVIIRSFQVKKLSIAKQITALTL